MVINQRIQLSHYLQCPQELPLAKVVLCVGNYVKLIEGVVLRGVESDKLVWNQINQVLFPKNHRKW